MQTVTACLSMLALSAVHCAGNTVEASNFRDVTRIEGRSALTLTLCARLILSTLTRTSELNYSTVLRSSIFLNVKLHSISTYYVTRLPYT